MLMSRRLLVVALGSLLILMGCGGGGGGGNNGSNSITYVTNWGRIISTPNGVSQRVTLTSSAGVLIDSKIINEGGTTDQVIFGGLAAGDYFLKAELNSATNFGGTITGESDAVITASKSASYTTKVGDAPTAASVTPAAASLTVQESRQFAATGVNGTGQAVFVVPGSFTWKTQGGVATVNSEGTVVGTNPGQGSVIATYVPMGFTDAAVLKVSPFQSQHSKWTVLVYMNAANDLDEFGDLNVNQMERVAGNASVRLVVQWKQANIPNISTSPSFIGTRRYLLDHDTTDQINSTLVQDMGTGVDMGDWHTLHDFIVWGQTFYPADRYVLVVWNHGNGWHRALPPAPTRGVSYDDDTGNSIQTWELNQAMGTSQVDILAWDASLMQMLEVDDEIRDKCDLIVGSEESPPGAGYPYDKVFQHFDNSPTDTTLNLAKAFVTETLAVPDYATQKITQSVLKGSQLAGLSTAVNQLGAALIAEKTANNPGFDNYIATARLNARAYSQSSSRTYRDLIGLTQELDKSVKFTDINNIVQTYTPPAAVTNADLAVRNAATAGILFEGHNDQSPGSNGISIDFSPESRFVNYSADYAFLKLAQDTQWNEWLSVAP